MKELEERIARDGIVKPGNVLKVDAFLNHQCDVELFDHMGAAWARLFADTPVDKILTIEVSGIGIARMAARRVGAATLRLRRYPAPTATPCPCRYSQLFQTSGW